MKFEFETIDNYHERAMVIGGWIVKAYTNVSHFTQDRGIVDGYDYRMSMCFVPDPDHNWVIDQEVENV